MKYFYLPLLLLIGFSSSASHIVGGEITYKYIGDSTGFARHYLVTLCLYHDLSGIPMGATQSLSYASSCNSGGSVTVNFMSTLGNGDTLQSAYVCACANQPGSVFFARSCYQTDIMLPTQCSDWEFSWQSCCRNPSISNLQNASGAGLYISSKLNNNFGPNSSPQFVSPAARQFCLNVNQPIVWINDFIESEFDSISVEFGQPLEGNGSNAPTPIPWATGYSLTSPLSSVNGVHLDKNTGSISFIPVQSEVVVMKIDISEFRFDTIVLNWVLVGVTTREIQIPIVASCNGPAINWTTQIVNSAGNVIGDTLQLNCGDDLVTINTSTPYLCSSLSSDGSDFLIYRSDGTLLPIVGASGVGCSSLYSTEINLNLHDTIAFNDTMYLVSHIGSDFNTITNYCGFDLASDDSIVLIVNNCSGIGLDEQRRKLTSEVFPNPSSDAFRVQFVQGEEKLLKVYDIRGQLVVQKSVTELETTINLASRPNGIYILEIQSSNWSERLKLLKN